MSKKQEWERHKQKLCRKHRSKYETKEYAEIGAKLASSKYGEEFSVFQCKLCGLWHIGRKYK